MDVEVDEEGRSEVGEFQIGEDLGGVNGEELVDGFQFDKDFVFDDEVGTETAFESETFVGERDLFLRANLKTRFG